MKICARQFFSSCLISFVSRRLIFALADGWSSVAFAAWTTHCVRVDCFTILTVQLAIKQYYTTRSGKLLIRLKRNSDSFCKLLFEDNIMGSLLNISKRGNW